MTVKRIHAFVKGRVQGVNYREFVRREGEILGLTGFIHNLKDGSVEIVAEGDEKQLKEFERRFRKGPLMALVQEAIITEEQPEGKYEGFDIHFS